MHSENQNKKLKFQRWFAIWQSILRTQRSNLGLFYKKLQATEKLPRIKRAGIFLLGIVIAIWVIKGCSPKPSPAFTPPKVIVQVPASKIMTDYITQTGTLIAFNSVDLVARIEGFLEKINFVDGSFVDKGQLLFIIEPQPYLDQLKEAQDTVISDEATYGYDQIELARQQRMYKQNATSLNSVQEWETKVQKSKAELDKSKASENSAAITYSYTHVLSPFKGRIGRHLVDIGNLVGNGAATTLATVDQIDPIYVYFNLNELDLIKVRQAAKEYGIKPEDLSDIPVYASLQDRSDFSHEGRLNFVNTGLNASTGTLEFRALLPNPKFELLPGLFVKVRVPLGPPSQKLIVPATSVQYDQRGAYVTVVDPQQIAQIRRVITGEIDGSDMVITKGLTGKDRVIISGLQNVTPGNQVLSIEQGRQTT